MATVVNARDIAIDGASHITVTIPGKLGWSGITDDNGNKPADNADPTQDTIVTGITVTGGGITMSSGGAIKGGQTAYATGTGWFLGYSGSAYKFSIGDSTHFLKWDGSAMSFAGNLSGAGTISWTGPAKFNGVATVGGVQVALSANDAVTQDYGIYAAGKVAAIFGSNFGGATGIGIRAQGGSGIGLQGEATTGTSLKLTNTGGGKLMDLPSGKFSTGANTPTLTNCPGSGTAKWVEIYDSAGNKHWLLAVKDT